MSDSSPQSAQANKLRPAKVSVTAEFSSLLFLRVGSADRRAALFSYGPAYDDKETHRAIADHHRLSGVISQGWDRWFIFYVEDCFCPPMYAVNDASFQDAYEEFLCECEHLVRIEPEDLKDYDAENGLTWNDNGTPCDTEGVRGFEVKLVEAKA